MMPPDADLLAALADAADAETLPRFRAGGTVDNKLDEAFDPVTEADRAAEQAIVKAIRSRFPDDAILGEEFGVSGHGDRLWVIDPIDGTRAFISGIPVWGTLIGFCERGRAVAGLMSQPFTGERFVADASGARLLHRGGSRPLKVRAMAGLADATLFTTDPRQHAGGTGERFRSLESRVKLSRYGTDSYAFCMLAAGQVDLVVESGLKPYDIVALIPVVERAGGIITTFAGARAEDGGDIIAAATPELHRAALEIMGG